MFDNFFAKQRTLVNETSKLPIDYFKRESSPFFNGVVY